MDSDPEKLCRLCLQTSDDVVNIWRTFQDSTIASILVKHFWFQIHKNDGLTEWLCQICWIQTKTFHQFYKQVEQFQKCFYDSVEKGATVDIDLVDAAALEASLSIVKCEETLQETVLKFEAIDSQIIEEDNADCNDDEVDNICDDSDNSRSSGDEDRSLNNEPKTDDGAKHSRTQPKHRSIRRSEKERRNAEIREFFTLKCEICSDTDVTFESFYRVKQHYRKVHNIRGYLTCCGKKYRLPHELLEHIRWHRNPNTFRCDQCGKSLKCEKTLKRHVKNHTSSTYTTFICNLCSKTFANANSLKYHVESNHTSPSEEKLPCDRCSKTFQSKLLLANHIRNVHGSIYVCEVCARRFKSKSGLQFHTNNEHSSTPPSKVQCDICGRWFNHKLYLSKHIKMQHQVSNSKAINCHICNKEARNKNILDKHIRSVHGERRHKCLVCDKAFKCTKLLKEHQAVHTGEDLYDCPYCEKKFKSSANLYSHRKKVHLVEWTRDCRRNTLKKTSANGKIESELYK